MHAFIHSLAHSFLRSFLRSFVRLFVHSFLHPSSVCLCALRFKTFHQVYFHQVAKNSPVLTSVFHIKLGKSLEKFLKICIKAVLGGRTISPLTEKPPFKLGWKFFSTWHLRDGPDRMAASVEATLEWGVHSKPRGSSVMTRGCQRVIGWFQQTTVDGRNPAPPGMYQTL